MTMLLEWAIVMHVLDSECSFFDQHFTELSFQGFDNSTLVQVMACWLILSKPWPESMITHDIHSPYSYFLIAVPKFPLSYPIYPLQCLPDNRLVLMSHVISSNNTSGNIWGHGAIFHQRYHLHSQHGKEMSISVLHKMMQVNQGAFVNWNQYTIANMSHMLWVFQFSVYMQNNTK